MSAGRLAVRAVARWEALLIVLILAAGFWSGRHGWFGCRPMEMRSWVQRAP